jgi:hypothetical protein
MLVLPSANRVYGRAAPGMACAELRAFGADDAEVVEWGGVPYVTFATETDVSAASCLYALFAVEADGLLRPVPGAARPPEGFDDSLVTIQRYPGKTNEQFTKLLLNLAWLAAGRPALVAGLRVLDPVAGRGTTLNHALLRGWSAAGVERDVKSVDAYEVFLRQWLQDHRVKHHFTKGRVRRDGRVVGRRFEVSVGAAGSAGLALVMVADDTRFTAEHFGKAAFDLVVADLPYSVQHRDQAGRVVAEALGGWASALKAGGGMALACNVRALPADALAALVEDAGLAVVDCEGFAHRVDQAIQRDVVVAVKR